MTVRRQRPHRDESRGTGRRIDERQGGIGRHTDIHGMFAVFARRRGSRVEHKRRPRCAGDFRPVYEPLERRIVTRVMRRGREFVQLVGAEIERIGRNIHRHHDQFRLHLLLAAIVADRGAYHRAALLRFRLTVVKHGQTVEFRQRLVVGRARTFDFPSIVVRLVFSIERERIVVAAAGFFLSLIREEREIFVDRFGNHERQDRRRIPVTVIRGTVRILTDRVGQSDGHELPTVHIVRHTQKFQFSTRMLHIENFTEFRILIATVTFIVRYGMPFVVGRFSVVPLARRYRYFIHLRLNALTKFHIENGISVA